MGAATKNVKQDEKKTRRSKTEYQKRRGKGKGT
jgi:hypothetical protein